MCWWMELAQNRSQCRNLVLLAALIIRVPLQETQCVLDVGYVTDYRTLPIMNVVH